MSLFEVSQILKMNPSTIYNNWGRTQRNLKKKGIILTRWKINGKRDYEYEIEYDYMEFTEKDKSYLPKYERKKDF